jgi:Mrp family chromosome partitioning ATPase
VGKSFVAVSLSASLSKENKVGILDADIHGPSIAKMLGFEGKQVAITPQGVAPVVINPSLLAFSMASLISGPDMPVIWRGPLKMGALKQFIGEVVWGELDYLIVDAPPGTGDEPLSICQLIPDMDGAIIVTTPQEVALSDSRKCVQFLIQLRIPILGIIENMSEFTCPHCGKRIDIFKTGGGEKAARELGIPFFGRIPLDPNIVDAGDSGVPFIDKYTDSPTAQKFSEIVEKIRSRIEKE